MKKKELVEFVTELIRATIQTSGVVYESKEIKLDDNFSVDILNKWNAEGWRMLCTGSDLGLKNKNIIIMERAKPEFQLDQIAARVAHELGIPEDEEVQFDPDPEEDPETTQEDPEPTEEEGQDGDSSAEESGSGETFV